MRRFVIGGVLLIAFLSWSLWGRPRLRSAEAAGGTASATGGDLADRFRDDEQAFAHAYSLAETEAERNRLVNEHLMKYFGMLYVEPGPEERRLAEPLLREALESNPDRGVRAFLCYELAHLLRRRSETDPRAPLAVAAGFSRQAEGMMDRLVLEYGDVQAAGTGHTFGEAGAIERDALRRVGIGRVAPEIEGEDLEGRPMKLSDFRGKVVLLVFWASWARYWWPSLPNERALARRMEGKPFVLIGVNCDETKERAITWGRKEGITWRSWFDGPDWRGTLATRWDVQPWPAFYLLDRRGVIRYRKVGHPFDPGEVDEAIDAMLAEPKSEVAGGVEPRQGSRRSAGPLRATPPASRVEPAR
jgi:hypothetical protein